MVRLARMPPVALLSTPISETSFFTSTAAVSRGELQVRVSVIKEDFFESFPLQLVVYNEAVFCL